MSKTTELAPVSTGGLIQYDPEEAALLRQELAEEGELVSRGYRPTLFSVGAVGSSTFANRKTKEIMSGPLTGVVLAFSPGAAFWTEKFGKGGDKMPFCSSVDGNVGTLNDGASQRAWDAAMKAPKEFAHPAVALYAAEQPLPDHHDCATCACNKWRSGRYYGADSEGAKACNSYYWLLTLLDGWFAPVILKVSKGSLTKWEEYKSTLLSRFGKLYVHFRTEISVDVAANSGNIDYSQLAFRLAGKLTAAEYADAQRLRTQFRYLISPDVIRADMEYYAGDDATNGQSVDESTGEILDGEGPPF